MYLFLINGQMYFKYLAPMQPSNIKALNNLKIKVKFHFHIFLFSISKKIFTTNIYVYFGTIY